MAISSNQSRQDLKLDKINHAKAKAAKYCAYQERTRLEVLEKLLKSGINESEAERIIAELIEEGFVNETRYAIAYARGKFHQNKWGKLKIDHGLKQKGLNSNCRKSALDEIDDAEYANVIKYLINRKNMQLKDRDLFIRKNKITSYLFSKGYEREIIWNILNELFPG